MLTHVLSQHNVVPPSELVENVTHVALAFMRSDVFNVDETPTEFPLFTTVESVRAKFAPDTKVMVAIGGWGDSTGFEVAAKTEENRKRWVKQVHAMVVATGADGIDIDWEYPGYVFYLFTRDSLLTSCRGNRDDYKEIPNSEREWEIEAYVLLLQELRAALGPDKVVSAAVPGKEGDLMAFTSSTVPRILQQLDFLNVMTYDLMNRRDEVVKHHSGVADSLASMKLYMDRGAPAHKLNLGLGYYVKWFMTQECDSQNPLGCPTQLLEDPDTGADLGKTGAFSWHDEVPGELSESFARAKTNGKYFEDGSYGYWDAEEKRWWSFDTPKSIWRKFPDIITPQRLGGVFAWGIGEDAPDFEHFKATINEVRQRNHEAGAKDEL